MAEWQYDRMAEWQYGRMGMTECRMTEWQDGGMAEWRDGGMADWRNGGMVFYYIPNLSCYIMVHPNDNGNNNANDTVDTDGFLII
jgi:hypothetical protein